MAKRRGRIIVAAGTNGAGKSAIVGEYLADKGGAYFNPDLFARQLAERGTPREQANAQAWKFGFNALQRAIASNEDFTFETTLGGESIVAELHRAIANGLSVRIWYVGLASPQMHIDRVKARVMRGGHDIPAAKIRERYPKSLANLVSLIDKATEIHAFDNSVESSSGLPVAQLVLRMRRKRIVEPDVASLLSQAPEWAQPVIAAALKVHRTQSPARPRKA